MSNCQERRVGEHEGQNKVGDERLPHHYLRPVGKPRYADPTAEPAAQETHARLKLATCHCHKVPQIVAFITSLWYQKHMAVE